MFVEILLVLMYVLLTLAVVATVFSIVRTVKVRGKDFGVSNGVPAMRIALTTFGLLLILLALTFLAGSDAPLLINGEEYADGLWLKISDMFINSSLILLLICSVLVIVMRFRR